MRAPMGAMGGCPRDRSFAGKGERSEPHGAVMRRWLILGALAGAAMLSGCATVESWQRGNLADYTMRSDRDPLAASMTEHIYFSREASSGGRGLAGGGCGCN